MFQMLTLCQNDWQRAKAQNESFETLYGDQFSFINLVDKTKLPCYTLPLKLHHSFFRILLSLFLCIVHKEWISGLLEKPENGENLLS